MATVEPFEGTRYNPEHVKLGGVLAPPYDVITDEQREELYGRDLRNIVRIDYGICLSRRRRRRRRPLHARGVVPDVVARARRPRPRRAAGLLRRRPSLPRSRRRRAAPARPARDRGGNVRGSSPIFARTSAPCAAPRLDRLALMRATRAQTSPVFAVWTGRRRHRRRARAMRRPATALLGGRIDGEIAFREAAALARRRPAACRGDRRGACAAPSLYIADGHHRYETAAAYAAATSSG